MQTSCIIKILQNEVLEGVAQARNARILLVLRYITIPISSALFPKVAV